MFICFSVVGFFWFVYSLKFHTYVCLLCMAKAQWLGSQPYPVPVPHCPFSKALYQCSPVGLVAITEMFYVCVVQ